MRNRVSVHEESSKKRIKMLSLIERRICKVWTSEESLVIEMKILGEHGRRGSIKERHGGVVLKQMWRERGEAALAGGGVHGLRVHAVTLRARASEIERQV